MSHMKRHGFRVIMERQLKPDFRYIMNAYHGLMVHNRFLSMKKIISYTVLALVLTFGVQAHAQMMGMQKTSTSTAPSETQKEEAEGKAIWDKLQNKEVACKDLTDDNFDILADFFMGNMMGANHGAMNEMMADRLGEKISLSLKLWFQLAPRGVMKVTPLR